jgi:hypothetical protein
MHLVGLAQKGVLCYYNNKGATMIKQLMTRDELMTHLKIKSINTYKNLVRRGCPCIRISDTKLMFDVTEVENWLYNETRAPKSEEIDILKKKGYVTTYNGKNLLTDKGTKKLLSK